ncbi:unnamed protein product [Cladocopium goreaui]|uniref:ABC-type oligopeptide transporter ABCB9 (ATP-binding cassette sub-family B member 9) (ATP-binding cassette transporter 9) (ABC transporter 9 protein) (TAP-like protein) (TAPL) n=1 Tax=Cladocopium goreaui TaxID=2562237 RepID=A0A9P1DDB2_9DINO|nr:unnamed protein product [Cladocopium goreaui]
MSRLRSRSWSLWGPLICCLLRLLWLSLLLTLALQRRHARASGGSSRINFILHEAFPYVGLTLVVVLCMVRLISDPPKLRDNDVEIWSFLLLSLMCALGETYQSLAQLLRLATVEPQALDVELPATTDASTPTLESPEATVRKKKDSAVWKLLRLVAHEWPLLIQAGIFLVVAAIADVLIPHYISQTISQIILAEEQGTLASRPYRLPVLSLLLAAGASAVFSACRGATFFLMGGRLAQRLRCTLFASLMQQDIGFFDVTQIGELTSRMTQDCQQVVDQAYLNVNVFLRTLVSIVATLAFMFSITTPLTCVAFVTVPAVVQISMKFSNTFQQISEEAQKSLADANAVANESLGNMSTVRSFAAEELEMQRFGVAMGVYRKLMKKRATYYLAYLSSTMMLPQLVTALVLFYGGKVVVQGQMNASSLLSFVFYLQTLNNNFSTLGDFWTNMIQAAGAAVRVFELCERSPELPSSGEMKPQEQMGALVMRDLHFRYPARPEVKVLEGLNLDIPASQVVALVGPSGNGKSTVISLIKRLYHVSAGEILLDGIPIWQYSHWHFHQVVSIVGQEPVLFARSIRENILLGLANPKEVAGKAIPASDVNVSEDEIRDFARKANADDFICRMNQGYDALVGERGVQLSGGQKQRIAIARALARRPKVLLLDEATSALDAESEQQVQRAIDGMIQEGCMTVVIIAHRLSTVKNSHKICVIKGGQVVEEGTHEELLKRGGSYFQLVECQLNAGEQSSGKISGRAPAPRLQLPTGGALGADGQFGSGHLGTTCCGNGPPVFLERVNDYLRLQNALRIYAERFGPIAEVGMHWNLDKTLVASAQEGSSIRNEQCDPDLFEAASQVHCHSPRDVSIESPGPPPNGPNANGPGASSERSGMAEAISKTIASIEDSMNLPSWLKQIRQEIVPNNLSRVLKSEAVWLATGDSQDAYEFRLLPDLEVVYLVLVKNTFIHVEDPQPTGGGRRRKKSAPPCLTFGAHQPEGPKDRLGMQQKILAPRSSDEVGAGSSPTLTGRARRWSDDFVDVDSPPGVMRSSTTATVQDLMARWIDDFVDVDVNSPPGVMRSSTTSIVQDLMARSSDEVGVGGSPTLPVRWSDDFVDVDSPPGVMR